MAVYGTAQVTENEGPQHHQVMTSDGCPIQDDIDEASGNFEVPQGLTGLVVCGCVKKEKTSKETPC